MILLDTHVLVWLAYEEDKLSRSAVSAIRRARLSDGIAISDIVIWELAFLFARRIIRSQSTVQNAIQQLLLNTGVVIKPIDPEIATVAAQFPESYPKDPADRIIGATALSGGLLLVTRDERIRNSGMLRTLW